VGKKSKWDLEDLDFDSFDSYESDSDSDFDDIAELAKDFYSTDWEDPAGSDHRISARRKIERRNELRDLFSQFDDWDDPELEKEW
jgi:hypothetical protein